jgi:hypothetical protein
VSSIGDIRAAIADALEGVGGLRCTAYEPAKVACPAAVVGDVEIDYDLAFGTGCYESTIKLRIYVSKVNDKAAGEKLDAYVSPDGASSVRAALYADKQLGGACDDLRVAGMGGYGFYDIAGVDYLGAEFTLKVLASGV